MEEVNRDKKPVITGVFEGHSWGHGPSLGYGIFSTDAICPTIPAQIGGYGIVILERQQRKENR